MDFYGLIYPAASLLLSSPKLQPAGPNPRQVQNLQSTLAKGCDLVAF